MDTTTTRDPDDPKKSCFVIMPYDDEFNPVLDAITDAVANIGQGLCCVRLDKVRYPGKISDEMVARIAKSTLCIADLTGTNKNVMWEAGYAMALKRPTVLISQDASTLPFNLTDYRVFEYDLSKGRKMIALVIESAIRDTLAVTRSRRRKVARWAAAAAVVVLGGLAGLYAFRPRIEPAVTAAPAAVTPAQNASTRCDLIHVAKDKGRVRIQDDVYVQLHHIETLQGNAEGDSLTGHEFNKKYLDTDRIFERALRAVGIPETVAFDMRKNDQKWWDAFRAGDEKRKRLTSLPLAQISIFRGSETLIDAKYFLEGERLPEIRRPGVPPIELELVDTYNTKRSSDESIALRLVTEASPQSTT